MQRNLMSFRQGLSRPGFRLLGLAPLLSLSLISFPLAIAAYPASPSQKPNPAQSPNPKLGQKLDPANPDNFTTYDQFQRALAIARAEKDLPQERLVLSGLGKWYRQQGALGLAIAFFKQSVNVTEALRRDLRYRDRQGELLTSPASVEDYRLLADYLLLQGRVLEAQQVLELMKAQEIREFTRNATLRLDHLGIAPTAAEEQILQQHGRLVDLEQRVEVCRQARCPQLGQLNSQIQALTQQYQQAVEKFDPTGQANSTPGQGFVDPNQFRAKAQVVVKQQPNTVLIYPLLMTDKLWLVWASPNGGVQSRQLPIDKIQLGLAVVKLRQLLQDPVSSPEAVKTASKQIYDWMIKPLEPELKANRIQNLVFSLDRTTRYIPMAALFDGQQYLIESYNISTVLSADLTDMGDRPSLADPNTATLALGVAKSVLGFAPLPNVPEEIDAIVRQPPEREGVYLGRKFLDQAFSFRSLRDNLAGHKILHIATHAQFTAGRPEASFMVLGNGEKLTMPTIRTLTALSGVQLVVLSACETALGGPDQEGIEISGVSSYFLNGGAKAVMASLWAVDDASTSELMQSFYGHLASGKPGAETKAAALRRSQLELLYGPTGGPGKAQMSEFSHPYFWAPFVITGNGF
jgi:CHAT domain-containing protein